MVPSDEERARGWQELEFNDIALYLEAVTDEFILNQNKRSSQFGAAGRCFKKFLLLAASVEAL